MAKKSYKAAINKGSWQGYAVKARPRDKAASDFKQVSPAYHCKSAAEDFLQLYRQHYPEHAAFITEIIRR